MNDVHILDLHFQGVSGVIAVFLIKSKAGGILIETGPHSCIATLKRELAVHGMALEDIRHVLLSHIHLDHAGAAWQFAQAGAQVYVHPKGARHLIQPGNLWKSAQQIYGDKMQVLWGEMQAIPETQVHQIDHLQELSIGEHTFTALHSPGHAKHHIAWEWNNSIFTGDVGGVKIRKGPIVPPCPPPDIDLSLWRDSIQMILQREVAAIYLTHFGKVVDVKNHLASLAQVLEAWAEWMKPHFLAGSDPEKIIPLFEEYTDQAMASEGSDPLLKQQYALANPAWMSVYGLMRYWKKRDI